MIKKETEKKIEEDLTRYYDGEEEEGKRDKRRERGNVKGYERENCREDGANNGRL